MARAPGLGDVARAPAGHRLVAPDPLTTGARRWCCDSSTRRTPPLSTTRTASPPVGCPARCRRPGEVDYGDLNGAPVDVVDRERLAHIDLPFPGGQSYRDVTAGVRTLLEELLRDHDGQRLLLVGHAATRFALDLLLTGRPLEVAVTTPFEWRAGWTYEISADGRGRG